MKPPKIFVRPARPGMNLRHPVSGVLPDHGRRWVDDAFTRRRIADGGVIEGAAEDVSEVDEAAGDQADATHADIASVEIAEAGGRHETEAQSSAVWEPRPDLHSSDTATGE